jgi:hypothetical protein
MVDSLASVDETGAAKRTVINATARTGATHVERDRSAPIARSLDSRLHHPVSEAEAR